MRYVINGTATATLATSPYTYSLSNQGPGTYTITSEAMNSTTVLTISTAQTFTVSPYSQTITFSALTSKPFGTAFTVAGTSTSGLTVAFTSATTSVCTVSGTTVTPIALGTCTIDANQAGNTDYTAATQVAQSATITVAPQTITFGALTSKPYGTPFTVAGTSTSGLTVAFTSATTSVCTVSGTTVTPVSTGTCTIDANQAGNTDYAAATQVAQSTTITAAPQTITFSALTSKPYGASFTVAGSSTSGLTVAFTSATTSVCTVSGTTVTPIALGTCTIDANQAGNTDYAAATQVAQSATITAAPQTITVNALTSKPFGTAFTVAGTSTSGLTVAFTSATTSVCTVSGTTVTPVALGVCTIDANQAGNTDYTAAPQVAQSVTITQATQTITFAALSNQTYGVAPVTLAATSTSGLAVAFTSATTSVCTVSGTTMTIVGAGPCTINANQAGNTNYAAAAQVPQTMTVAPTTQTITFGAIANKPFGTPFTVAATSTSGLAVAFTSATTSTCTVSGTTVTPVAPGTCTIDANQAGNTNYSPATQAVQSTTIGIASQAITFSTIPTQSYAVGSLTLTATSTSGLAITYTTTTPAVCTVSGATLTIVAVGSCTVDANQAGNTDYAAATQAAQTFTVAQATQTITFYGINNQIYGVAPLQVGGQASSSSGLAITSFTSSTPAVCTVSGAIVTIVGVGTCTLSANQSGNSNYLPATQSTSFAVAQEAQTITFAPPATTPFSATPLTLTGTSTSGLALTYTSTSATICTVSGSAVNFVALGNCVVTASQTGNADFTAATAVSQTIAVTQGSQSITFTPAGTEVAGESPFTVAATSTTGLTVTLASATPAICTVSGTTVTAITAGACTITGNQAGNTLYAAAPQQSLTITILPFPLTISITDPVSGQQLDAPVNLTLTARAVDTAGTITQVTFYNNGSLIGTVNQAPYSMAIPNAANGSYAFTAKAVDNNGLTATSAPVTATIAANGSGELIYYINADQLNTPRVITDSDGNVVWRWDGEPFGNTPPTAEVTGAGLFVFNLRFPGQYYDAETNLAQNLFRDYDQSSGRYVESDPIGLRGGISTYSYVGGNPFSDSDPKGLAPGYQICIDGVCPVPPSPVLNPIDPGWPSPPPSSHVPLPPVPNALKNVAMSASMVCDAVKHWWNSDEEDNDKVCAQKLELEEGLCEALAIQWGKRGQAVCKSSAFTRYSECLRNGPEGVTTPLHGVDTPL
jgi:RHS repeat-associated protein